ncbi:hypothetical protein KK060_24915, partial [Fulvivirgaceae bacterium PWU20]|nr:hypothetical protein [Chryseosolibacter indicus]
MHHCLGSACMLTCISIAVCTWDSEALEHGNAAYANRYGQRYETIHERDRLKVRDIGEQSE